MRYDIENAAADVMKAYLVDLVDPAIQEVSPIVTFYDPMSVDEANRIVVMVPSGQTRKEDMASGVVMVEIGIKSRWTKKTVKQDFAAHFARVADVRDKLFVDADQMADDINATAAAQNPPLTGLAVDYLDQGRSFRTEVREGWLYTETSFQMSYYTTT